MADFLLSVGVDAELSYDQMQKDISGLVSQLNNNPPKVKIGLDIDNAAMKSIRDQISQLSTIGNGENGAAVDISTIQRASSAWNDLADSVQRASDVSKSARGADVGVGQSSQIKELTENSVEYYNALRQVNTLLTQVTNNQAKWTAAKNGSASAAYSSLGEYATKLQSLKISLQYGPMAPDEFDSRMASIRAGVSTATNAIKAAGEATQSWSNRIQSLSGKFSTWLSITHVIMTGVRAIKQMVSASIELEDAMAQLEIVTDASGAKMNEFLRDSTALAKELGKSITDVLSSVEVFSRLGYNLTEATELAKYANILSNVASVDTDTATTGLTSIIKGYSMDVSEAEHIADVLVDVGQKYAISAEELMAAFQRGGAALAASGTDFEKSAALFAATNASLQNAESVGTLWKTVSARIRGATTELSEMGEDTEGLAGGLSKYREELQKLSGVDIMLDKDTYKDMYTIFVELAGVWDNITSDESRARIAEILGGTRQLSGIMSTITNIKDAMGAYEAALDSAGTATRANDIYMETATAHIEQFKASFQELSANLISSGLLTGIISIGNAILNLANSLEKLHVLLPLIAASVSLISANRRALRLEESISSVNGIASAIIKEKGVTDELTVSVMALSVKQKQQIATQVEAAVAAKTIDETQKKQILTALGLATAEGTLTAANKTLGVSFKSLISSVPVFGWIALGISLILDVIIPIIDGIKSSTKSIEELDQEWKELSDTIQNSAQSFQSLKSEADDIIPKYAQLAQGVNKYGENVSLTSEEFDEFVSLNNRLGEMFPELVAGYDSNGNAILNLSGNVDTLTESLYNCVEAQRLASSKEIAYTMSDVMDNIEDSIESYEDEIDNINKNGQKEKDAIQARVSNFKEAYNEFSRLYSDATKDDLKSTYGDSWEDVFNANIESASYYLENEMLPYIQNMIGSQKKLEELLDKYKIKDQNGAAGIDWYGLINSDEIQEALSDARTELYNLDTGITRQIEDINNRIASKWKQLNPVVSAWLQTDFMYQDLDNSGQKIAERMMRSIDFSSLGLKTAEEVQKYITDYVINPIYDMDADSKNAFYKILDVESAFNDGKISAQNYIDQVSSIISSADLTEDSQKYLSIAFDINDIQDKVNHVKDLLSDEFDDMASSLTLNELEIAYKIVKENGSMSFDQLKAEIIDLANTVSTNPIETWDDLGAIFDSYTKSMEGLSSIQEAVANGFIISADAAREFAKTYPEILQSATVSGNGQIKLNEDVVNNFLDGKTAELKGSIDAQIAQLEAYKAVLEAKRASAEAQLDIANQVGEGEGKIAADVAAYRIDCGNIMTQALIDQGIDEATAFQLAAAAMAGDTDEFNRIAKEVCTDVSGNFDQAAYSSAQAIYNNMQNGKISVSQFATQCQNAARAMAGIASGEVSGSSEIVGGGAGGVWGDGPTFDLHEGKFQGSNYTYVPKKFDLDSFISDLELDISNYTSKIEEIDGQIAVLNALKNKPIEQFNPNYGKNKSSKGGGSGNSAREVEEYVADVEKYTEALQKLSDAENKQLQLEADLEQSHSYTQRASIREDLVQAYKDRQAALHELNNLRDETIRQTIPHLEELGFQIEYNDEINRLYISNLEHLNELEADSAGQYETVQEATNALRKDTEGLIDDITELNADNQESSKIWLELADSINSVPIEGYEDRREDLENAVDFSKIQFTNAIAQGDFDAASGHANDIVDYYRQMQDSVHDQAEHYRRLGYSETSEEIAELKNLWREYQDDINEITADGYESRRAQIESAVDFEKAQLANAVEQRDFPAVADYTDSIISHYKQMQDSVHSQAEYYRSLGYSETSEEISELKELWLEYRDSLVDIVAEGYDALIEKAIDSVSSIQDVYDSLKSAADEYAETGKVSIDLLKTMSEIGIQYMSYLQDENGMLVINKDRINDVIAARTRQLGVDTALSYVEKLRLALADGNIAELERLTSETEVASNATWDLVYANLALLDLDDVHYKQALDNINKIRSLSESAAKSVYTETTKERSEMLQDTQDALDTILDLTMQLIEYETNQKIEALEDQIDKYREIIDLKKKSLEETKEENDYNKEVKKKIEEIAKLQSRIEQLSLDDSREAQAEKKSLEEDLADLQSDLADYQSDRSIEKQQEMLDDMADAYEKEKKGEIEDLENSISSQEKLYRLAIDRIDNHWDGLYEDILNWNYEAGNSIESEIVEAWKRATRAVQEYGSFSKAVTGLKNSEGAENTAVSTSGSYGVDPKSVREQMRENSLKWYTLDENGQEDLSKQQGVLASQLGLDYDNGTWYLPGSNDPFYTLGKWEVVDYITKAMRANSKKWNSASQAERVMLEQANNRMAHYIEQVSGQKVWLDDDGYWWIGNDKLYDSYGKYHSGGAVGTSTPQQDEVMAILQKGELVLDKTREKALYELVDFVDVLSDRLGSAIDIRRLSNVMSSHPATLTTPSPSALKTPQNNIDFSPSVTIEINHNGNLSEQDARRYGKAAADSVLQELNNAFNQRGINSFGGILKQ